MNSTVQNTITGFVSMFTPVLGHEVHALVGGNEDPDQQIIMIQGALASRRYLLATATALSKAIRVYVPEMPGHGGSSIVLIMQIRPN